MRNEMTMYTLKPIVSLPRILHHRKMMYEMRNIHEESTDDHTEAENKIVPDITEQVISFLKSPLPEYNALEARQEKILAQLAELKKQVSTLSGFLKQTNQVAVINKSVTNQKAVNVNLIINVNPKRPPYFISALQNLWEDTDIKVQTYVHSSINKEGSFVYQSTTNSPKNNIINLSLIWKDVEDLQLVSGLHSYCITGETNFLRYISRLINSHNYENSDCIEKLNTTDLILDLCHSLYFEESSKKKQEILSLIADKLNINKRKLDIADIAAWSTIKQIFPNKYPPKLNKWFEACEKIFI
ncbi:aminoacyl tRNA synthase complex-interacting multifunctional protein 2 isoform X1 [Apis mellifera caucasica]|uniref:Aminoacyl tRNA synthase complex-interacting multifunctional protein 2 isoform X1 n=1 Tax=Apis mellifera TaxID=7460 RepID=A0A7M7R5T1_APIME|nr:aminoacyl tRNA synthase complex-interacting multifunctional protein 2 isoform X1 [Apis mellifera]KAG6795678.1 aminoacyl tRNA synthase complex-interacting multifunctional protein 2 isoform X1 [Apis mellifera caucasica]KAG9433027.1 aminoacyl tRNA synthase complex-interacting multifunctional protein 2 isoform X1 [Apis mellifera carnica]|eukprot:XP_392919.3 aminoacyl tRNA synthase complex-interacting multifunctional protein 2 isoform X1 [Apis mellifera]